MTLQEFIEKIKTDEALNKQVKLAILEKVLLPMAGAEGVELTDEELEAVNGGSTRLDHAPLEGFFAKLKFEENMAEAKKQQK